MIDADRDRQLRAALGPLPRKPAKSQPEYREHYCRRCAANTRRLVTWRGVIGGTSVVEVERCGWCSGEKSA